jgi:hypothetical protein
MAKKKKRGNSNSSWEKHAKKKTKTLPEVAEGFDAAHV